MTLISNKQTIKQLNSQLNVLEGNRKALNIQCSQIQQNLSENKKQINILINNIKKLELQESQELNVTEHALLRYCERVLGINIEEIKEELLSDNIKNLVNTLGSTGVYPYKEFKLKIINNSIITLLK